MRVIVGGILGFLLSLLAEEFFKFVPPDFHPWYVPIVMTGIVVSVAFLSGFFGAVIFEYRRWRRFRLPVKLAVLSGLPKACMRADAVPAQPIYCNVPKEDWIRRFESERRNDKTVFDVKEIHSSMIDEKYAVIVNPFGEVFPEEDRINMRTFERVKRFVADGGVFVCTGGFPFYYVWDYVIGRKLDTTPRQITITPRGGITPFRLFVDSLLSREFGVYVEDGGLERPIATAVFQRQEDIDFWGDIANVGGTNSVGKFRSILSGSFGIIPTLREGLGQSETYPLAGVRYGDGYLILSGMEVNAVSEFPKIVVAVRNLSLRIGRHI